MALLCFILIIVSSSLYIFLSPVTIFRTERSKHQLQQAYCMEGQPLSPSQVPYQYQATSMSGAEEQKEPADAEPSSLRQRIRGENAENPHQSNRQPSHDNPFECNVCLEPLQDPVCTLCGHLYCWPCLYRVIATSNIVIINLAIAD